MWLDYHYDTSVAGPNPNRVDETDVEESPFDEDEHGPTRYDDKSQVAAVDEIHSLSPAGRNAQEFVKYRLDSELLMVI